jgi:hypothetical protein
MYVIDLSLDISRKELRITLERIKGRHEERWQ